MKTKLFGLLTILSVICTVRAVASTGGTDLYSESLYLQKSSAEVPGSFEASKPVVAPAKVAVKAPAPLTVAKAEAPKSPEVIEPKLTYLSDDSDSASETALPSEKKAPVKKGHKKSK